VVSGSAAVDGAALVVFGIVAALSTARLATATSAAVAADRVDAGLHVAMATGMAAMVEPSAVPLPRGVWMVLFGLVGVVAVATGVGRRPASTLAHHAVGSACMVVAFAAGHGHGAHPGGSVDAATGTATAGVAGSLGPVQDWPIWPLVAAGFLLYAVWIATRPAVCRCLGRTVAWVPARVERSCTIVMAVGMAAMAYRI
jgi:hypothetical protein